MLKELAELLRDQGAAAERAKIVELPPETNSFGVWQQRLLETRPLPAKSRDHEALSLSSLFGFLSQRLDDDIDGQENYLVWVSDESIAAVEDNERRDQIRFLLTLTDQFKTVRAWESPPLQANQKTILYTLRTVFPSMVDNDLEAILRGLKWDIESDIFHDKSSVGKSIRSKHTNAGSVPEVVIFTVPVWQELEYRATIPVAIQANPENQTISLKTIAGAAEQGKRHALGQLFDAVESMASDKWPVFLGTP